MVARADALVEHVRSGDQGLRLKAVREMKNQVVGSRAKKLQMLKAGAVPHLLALLAADGTDPGLVVQVKSARGDCLLMSTAPLPSCGQRYWDAQHAGKSID